MRLAETVPIPPGCRECVPMSALLRESNALQDIAEMNGAGAMDDGVTNHIVEDMSAMREQQGLPAITAAEYRMQVANQLGEIDARQDVLAAEARALIDECAAKRPLEVRASQHGRGVLITICNSAHLETGLHIEAVPIIRYDTN